VRSFAELEDSEVALTAEAWRERASEGEGYVHAMVNEGRFAGASLAHSHSQLVWLREPPPLAEDAGAVAGLLEAHPLAEENGVVLAVHPVGRTPYELLIAPREPAADAFGARLDAALRLLRKGIRRLRDTEGPVSWNAWLHQGEHWHLEVVPKLTVPAGLELGAGLYVNVVPPEQAAAALRAPISDVD